MQNFTSKTDLLDAVMAFALDCSLPIVHTVGIDGKIYLVACEIDTREKIQSVLKTRGLTQICFRVMDRLDNERKQTFLFSK